MHDMKANIVTYFPYKNGSCGQYLNYELLFSCDDQSVEEFFPNKIPLDLQGCEIPVMAYPIQPYVMDVHHPPEETIKAGLEVTIIHNVAVRMNLRLKYLKNHHKHWGFRYIDGSFTNMFKELKERKVDLIFGFMYANYSVIDFDESFTHLQDTSCWFFPTASQMAQWKSMTNIFEKDLWLLILLTLVGNGIAWWVVGRTREPSDNYNDITTCIMSSMYVLLQGSVKDPETGKLRLIFVLWLVTSLLLFTAHQSQLISILTSTPYEKQMTTLEELLASGSQYGSYPVIEYAYRGGNAVAEAIIRGYTPCPLTVECLNRTAFHRDFAVIKNRRQVDYLMPRYYTLPNGRKMLYDTGITLFQPKQRYFMFKGNPLLDRINDILMTLVANGLIDKWDADTRVYHLKLKSDELEALNLNHLEGAFLILSFGLSLSILTFICEIGFRQYHIKKRDREQYSNVTQNCYKIATRASK